MADTQGAVSVGIAGAGAIGLGTAAFLEQAGHKPILWSPSGNSTRKLASGGPLEVAGAIEGSFRPGVAASAEELVASADIVLVALPANGHKLVYDAIAPHLREDQVVIISSHSSFGALYLSKLLAGRRVSLPIVAWGTTAVTARRPAEAQVRINTIRSRIDLATIPPSRARDGLLACQALFGDKFAERDGLLAITLSNLNPQTHMGMALCNMTRIENGESWWEGPNVTANVGRMIEAMDAERLAIADALDLKVRTIFEHLPLSYHVQPDSVSNMNREMHERGFGVKGPTTTETRYVLEDAPYGLHVTAALGRLTGRPATLHEAGVALFSALYGRDFAGENEILGALGLDALGLDELRALSEAGF